MMSIQRKNPNMVTAYMKNGLAVQLALDPSGQDLIHLLITGGLGLRHEPNVILA